MIRGTTPDLIFDFPFSVENIQRLFLTFSQHGKEVLTLTKDDCDLADNERIEVRLTQEQTLMFEDNSLVEMQFRILTNDGVALASKIMRTPMRRVLKEGAIQ